jgi:NAD(P)-dependent dehydrogenase (short-subunit alcohol dehydrogenase family)
VKTVAIIGANRGIGLELTKQYQELDYQVVAICRKASKELTELKVDIIEGIDVSSDESIPKLLKLIPKTALNCLIYNSGILISDNYSSASVEDILKHFQVNTLGALRIVKALESNLREGSKIGLVSSRVGSIEDNNSGNNYGYRISKTALNMLGKNLAIDLKNKGISIALLHPGYVKTEMTHYNGLIEPAEAAKGLIKVMSQLTLEQSGNFWHSNGETLPW